VKRWMEKPRLLGVAFLVVVVTSLIGGLFDTAAGSGNISNVLVSVAGHVTLARVSILGGVANSVGIIILAVLLYVVLRSQNKTIALVALGFWFAEAVFYAVMQLGAGSLIPLSQGFIGAGSPAGSFYQTLGVFLYDGVYKLGLSIHMWFYCLGGVLWYSLFYTSRSIPRALSVFGIAAVLVGTLGIVFTLLGFDVPIYAYLPIGVFEILTGFWLALRGIPERSLVEVSV